MEYIERDLEKLLFEYRDREEILAVIGPRRCGKTTILKHIASKLKNSVFLSFDDKSVLDLFEQDIKKFAETYNHKYKYIFIDEFQYAKNGGKNLKFLYDLHHTKMFVSGSSSIDLTINTVKFLVGRVFIMNLYPLSFDEFLRYKNNKLYNNLKIIKKNFWELGKWGEKVNSEEELNNYYLEYLTFGGYPQVVLEEQKREKVSVLKNIYNTYFLREVKDVFGLVDNYKLGNLIKGLSLQVGNLVDYKELGVLSDLDQKTIKKYLVFLEETFICSRIRPYFTNKRVEIQRNPKVYFLDTGVRNYIIGNFNSIKTRKDAGFLLENGIYQQAVKRELTPQFWRNKNKQEVDFVFELGDERYMALEVKKSLRNINWVSIKSFIKKYPQFNVAVMYLDKNEDKVNFPHYPIYLA